MQDTLATGGPCSVGSLHSFDNDTLTAKSVSRLQSPTRSPRTPNVDDSSKLGDLGLGRIDAEQPHELGAELHGIPVHHLKARPRARSRDGVAIGFRESWEAEYEQ
jgi:hypothetical protein